MKYTDEVFSRERARSLLGENYCEAGDYYLRTYEDGREELWLWGMDTPELVNNSYTSWS